MHVKAQGFSLVELVAILVLMGILGAVILPRFADRTVFDAAVLRDGLVSQARAARQMALGRRDVWLTLRPDGERLRVEIDDSAGQVRQTLLPLGGLPLSADVNQPASCADTPGGHAITPTAPLKVRYDSLGDLREGGVEGSAGYADENQTINSLRICIADDSALSLCLSPAGFAYRGRCDA